MPKLIHNLKSTSTFKKYIINGLGFLLSYYLLTQVEHFSGEFNNSIPLVSASGALGIYLLLFWGPKSWPILVLASLFSHFEHASNIKHILFSTFGNTIEALLSFYIFSKGNLLFNKTFSDYKKISSYILTLCLPVAINSLIQSFALSSEPILNQTYNLMETFSLVWSSRALGILLILPIISKLKTWNYQFNLQNSIQSLFIFAIGAATSYIIIKIPTHQITLFFLILPLILLSTQISALTCNLLVLLFSFTLLFSQLINTSHKDIENLSILNLQVLLISIALISFLYIRLEKIKTLRKTALFILGAWILGSFSVFMLENFEKNEFNNYFDTQTSEGIEKIKVRMSKYESALRGGAGLFLASKSVEKDDWKSYTDSLSIKENFPGIMGIGFIKYLPANEVDEFFEKVKKDQQSDFEIYNLNNTSYNKMKTSYPILYLEPLDSNKKAIGLNIASEINRKEAADIATETKQPTLSKTITLVQDNKKRAGYLLLYPVYKESKLLGWIYSPIVLDEFLGGILSPSTSQIGFRVYDFQDTNKKQALYESDTPQKHSYYKSMEFNAWSQNFKLDWFAKNNFSKDQNFKSYLAFITLNLIFYLLTIMMSNINLQGLRTQELVKIKTLEITNKEKLWRTLTESSPIGILQTDIFGTCQYANQKFSQIVDQPITQIEGSLWSNFCHPSDLDHINNEWKNYLDTQNLNIEFRAKPKDSNNSDVWISVIGSPVFNDDGFIQSHILSFQDITKAKAQLLTLAQSSKMASLGEMASGIAHEINNPLSIINGYAQKLLRNEEKGINTTEILRANLEKILNTTQRITHIIKGLKNFSRSGNNDSCAESSLRDLIEDVYSFCSDRFRNHSIKFTLNVPNNVRFESQTTQISQTILNLLNNSHDAIIEQAEKWIRVDFETLNEERFRIKFTDSGPGIPPDIVNKLMQPFFTTKGPGKGTGLGLSISKGIIESHNGKFYVDQNSPNTCFVIELPYKQSMKLKIAA
ncbi:MAG: CHASE domain-containing protein [Proteobacteria bacterium]|nr:CHASE domain-containing protein [Pseudomonadota bacterium]